MSLSERDAPAPAVREIVAALLTHQLRDLRSRVLPRALPRTVQWAAAGVALVATTLLTVQCWVLGGELYRSGVAFSTISVLVAVGASLVALTLVAKAGQSSAAVTWARQALTPLPLTATQLTALAHLAWAWPVAVVSTVALAPVAAFVLGIGAQPPDVVRPVAIGALVVVLPVTLAQLVTRRAPRAVGWATLPAGLAGALAAYGHAGWFVAQVDREVADIHERAPVVGLLVATGPVSWTEAGAWILALLAAVGACALVVRRRPRSTRAALGSTRSMSTRPLPLVTTLLLLTRKPSSVRAESVTMALAVVAGSWVAALLYSNGRTAHADVIVTWLGFVAALPLLSLRSGSGPTQRFTALGVRPADLAVAVTTVGLVLVAPTLLVGAVALAVAGADAQALVRLVLGGLLGALVAMTVSHVARELTRLSLGRIGVSWLLLVLFAGLSALGATRWSPAPGLVTACAVALGALVTALWLTVRVTTLDTTSEDS